MNFTESLEYLYARGHEMQVINLGLARIRTLAAAAGNPHTSYPAVLIAGTNGKGSTAATVFAIARAAGLRVGLYTSPHLVEITERMRLSDPVSGTHDISQTDFARLATQVRTLSETLIAAGKLDTVPSLFEQLTMIGFLWFAEQRVELAVLEVGLGGRLDATNICVPLVTAITPIDYDHQRHLGNTLAEIAFEKAGIIRTGVPVVVAPQTADPMQVITQQAAQHNAPLIAVETQLRSARRFAVTNDYAWQNARFPGAARLHYETRQAAYDAGLRLYGGHQVINALTAIHVAETLQTHVPRLTASTIVDGLESVKWPGRLEWIAGTNGSAPLLLDGAHNPAGARVVGNFLRDFCQERHITMIFGAMSDKPIDEMERILLPAAQTLIVAPVDNPRTATAAELAARAATFGMTAIQASSVTDALARARQLTPANGIICIAGSLYLVGEVKKLLKQ